MGARTRGLANNVLTSGKLDATDAISGVIPADNIANASLASATTYGSVTGGIPAVSSDPPSPSEGDIWYNTTTGKIRFRARGGTWATGNALNTARDFTSGAGTATSALCFGGLKPPGSTLMGENESWNGTSWTEVADLNTARGAQGAGNTSNALFFGGPPTSALTEEWDGSSWTEVGDLNTGREGLAGDGIYTAALAMSGTPSSPQNALTASEQWTGAGATLTRTFTVD